jgi:predicted enzyme related to lactoylglutathione lyase
MKRNPVGWFEIYVQDMVRARKFYEALFEHKLERLTAPGLEMWSFPMESTGPGCSGALVKMEGVRSGGNSVLVYFSCEDCGNEEARTVSIGGKIQRRKSPIGNYGFISLVLDTEGNMIGLHSMK